MAGLSNAKMDIIFTYMSGTLSVEYMSELYDASTVDRWCSSFEAMLGSVSSDVELSLAEISMLAPDALSQVVSLCGSYDLEFMHRPLLHHAFEHHACQSPDKVFLEFEGTELTLGQVNRQANNLAASLIARGIGLGDMVAVMQHRSPELIVSMLAVLKSGAGYLPCDPDYPDDRLSIYMEDAKVCLVLSQGSEMVRSSSLAGPGVEVVDVPAYLAECGSSRAPNPPRSRSSEEGVCYTIFTSGSTGRPKGVSNILSVRDLLLAPQHARLLWIL